MFVLSTVTVQTLGNTQVTGSAVVMKNKEIKKLTNDQLKNQINSIKKDLFNLRFKKINGQLEDTSKILRLKRDLAKVMTNLNKKN